MYTHFYIHPIFYNDTHASVRWTYTFHDVGMEFVIDKCFFISDDGEVICHDSSKRASNAQELRRLVFDHYTAYVESLRHLDRIMEENESMEP